MFMTETEQAIDVLENGIVEGDGYDWRQVQSACELAIAALRRTAEDDKAREEGRLVVLPCKVGDTVYRVCKGFISEEFVTRIYTVGVGEWRFRTEDFTKSNWNMLLFDFGKTVFLTRQEAEAALEGCK